VTQGAPRGKAHCTGSSRAKTAPRPGSSAGAKSSSCATHAPPRWTRSPAKIRRGNSSMATEMFTGVAVWHCPAGQASQPGLPPGVSRKDGGDGAATDASGFPRRCRGWALRLPTVLIRHDPSARCVCRLHSLAGRELRRWLHRSLELPRASCAVALPSHLLITPPDLPSAAFPDQERARACGAPTPRVP
jgi:hypothetical protein